jgi:hypothetical protein
MASNQPTQAVIVVPNDDINIPEPGSYKGGTNNGAGVNLSVPVGSGNFVSGDLNPAGTGYSNRVTGGDVAYEPSTGTIAQVIEVTGEDTLTLSAPGLTGGGAAFELYRGNGGKVNSKQGNEGFSLFVGTAGDLTVIPAASENAVVLKNVANNSYVPLQVARVLDSGTSAADILALR